MIYFDPQIAKGNMAGAAETLETVMRCVVESNDKLYEGLVTVAFAEIYGYSLFVKRMQLSRTC